ncbi:glycerol-3-phosphate dehydrogenase, partial [Vibrio parahaemolyticus]|nr:glycerol-3-phosphate dehydrogenase [Vibrio parahaemolyticus]
VFGGKLTTYRKLGEAAMKKLAPFLPEMGKDWTANQTLPGGNFSCSREQLAKQIHAKYTWAPEALILRYVTQFGTQTWNLMEGTTSEADLGQTFSAQAGGVYQREIDYLMNHEMAMTDE